MARVEGLQSRARTELSLYVFLFDPTVPGADYGLGRILAEPRIPIRPSCRKSGSCTPIRWRAGGSLLNLTPVKVPEPQDPQTK